LRPTVLQNILYPFLWRFGIDGDIGSTGFQGTNDKRYGAFICTVQTCR
jgi:hypothetical protein